MIGLYLKDNKFSIKVCTYILPNKIDILVPPDCGVPGARAPGAPHSGRPCQTPGSELCRFFMAYGMNEDNPTAKNVFVKSKLDLARLSSADCSQIHSFKLNMIVSKRKKQCMEMNMTKICNFLTDKHPEHNIDALLLVYFLFRFALERKGDLELFILSLQGFTNVIDIDSDEPDREVRNLLTSFCDTLGT